MEYQCDCEYPISLVKAELQDAEILTNISKRTFNDDANRFLGKSSGGPAGYMSVEWNKNRIKNDNYFKIVKDGKIIGGIIVFYWCGKHARLERIFVDPVYQGYNYGQRVMTLMENEFPEVLKWTLCTRCECYRNHHFYEKMGYVKVSEEGDLFFYEKNRQFELGDENEASINQNLISNKQMSFSDFRNVDMQSVQIEQSNLQKALFYLNNLNESTFQNMDMVESTFNFIDMHKSKIAHVDLSDIKLCYSIIEGGYVHDNNISTRENPTIIENCTMESSKLTGCNLTGLQISNCNISDMIIDGIRVEDMLKAYLKNKG